MSVLQVMLTQSILKAQISNELAFRSMILGKFAQKSIPIDTLTGFVPDSLRSAIQLSVGAKRSLSIEEPTVEYTKLDGANWLRRISTVLTFRDTMEIGFPLQYQDSIPTKNLRHVRKSNEPALRGVDPRWVSKYLGPSLLIGTGIAVIISLFYLRS